MGEYIIFPRGQWVRQAVKRVTLKRAVVVHVFSPSTQEAETGKAPEFEASLVYIQSESQDSQDSTESCCLE